MIKKITLKRLSGINAIDKRTLKCLSTKALIKIVLIFSVIISSTSGVFAHTIQNVTVPFDSYISNNGIISKTYAIGLKPFKISHVILETGCPVHLVIDETNKKDASDLQCSVTGVSVDDIKTVVIPIEKQEWHSF